MNLIAFGGGANCQQTDVATALSAHPGGTRMDAETETFIVAGTQQANGKAAGSATNQDAESGLLVVHGTQDPCVSDQAFTLGRNSGQENAVLAFSCKDYGNDVTSNLSPTLRAMGHGSSHANAGGQVAVVSPTLRAGNQRNNSNPVTEADMLVGTPQSVRRLTPRECERLQGFSDDYTLIPSWDGWRKMDVSETPEQCLAERLEIRQAKKSKRWYVKDADGPRYKAIGNSKAVPVVRWLGQRLSLQLEHR